MSIEEIIIGLAMGGGLLLAMVAGLVWVMSSGTDAEVRKEIEKWRDGK